MSAYITSIGTANPAHKIAQKDIFHFMSEYMSLKEYQKRELEILYRATGIQYRYSVLADYTKSLGEFSFYPNHENLEPFPSVSVRMNTYKKEALALSMSAIKECTSDNDFTHLIVVSCTGMYAPGLDIELVEALGLPKSIKRSCLNFMGCYAAINGLKIAQQACLAETDSKVLVVCLELCSIHFQKINNQDNLLANALFGDGAAAIVVESKPNSNINLEIENFHCDIVSEGSNDMAWQIGDFGFEMALSSYVPDILKSGISTLTQKLLTQFGLSKEAISYYAIHPGGKKILQVVENELGLTKADMTYSNHVLKNYGNMSSPTVLFVLKAIQDQLNANDVDKHILSFAFGPGLTLESMLLKVCAKND